MSNSRKLKRITIIRLFIGLMIVTVISCSSSKEFQQKAKSVKVFFSFPTLTATNRLIIISDSQSITYFKGYVLYKFPYLHETSIQGNNSEGKLDVDKRVKLEKKYQYFLYLKGDSNGYYFNSLDTNKYKNVSIDSFLRDRFVVDEKFLLSPNDSLFSRIVEKDSVIHEVYIRSPKNSKLDCDTNHLYFSKKLNDIDFSFSKMIDNSKGIKLFKVYQVSKAEVQNTDPFLKNRREVLMVISREETENNTEIIGFIRKYYKEFVK